MFTQEQIKEIKEKLAIIGSKDTSLPLAALPLTGAELIALVQNGENKRVSIDEFYEEFSQYIDRSERVDFFNISRYVQRITGADASVQLTLDEAVQACPTDVRRGGQILTFIDNDSNWTMWQYVGVTPDSWEDTDNYWDNLESDPHLGVILLTSVNQIEFGTSADVVVSFETVDKGKARKVELYVNNVLFQTYYNVAKFTSIHTNVRSTTSFKVRATQYGRPYQVEAQVNVVYPAWIGAGNDESEVQVEDNRISVSTEAKGTFDVVFDETSYLYIIVPESIILNPITMSGFEVPMQVGSVMVIDNVNYRYYKSANAYIEGTHRFVIGTYNGNERDLISSLQHDVAGLQTLMGEQEEINNEQGDDITETKESLNGLSGRLNNLEENTYNTTDEEDLTTVNNKYKFANKAYSAINFTGKGRIYLRKNIRQVEEQIDENTSITRTINMLTPFMMANTNTLFHVQYDYTLRDSRIVVPSGSGLIYEGGSFSDGVLDISDAILFDGWERLIGSRLSIVGVPAAGSRWFDRHGVPIWSNGTNWIYADGTAASL